MPTARELAIAEVAKFDAQYKRAKQQDVVILNCDGGLNCSEIWSDLVDSLKKRPKGRYEIVWLTQPTLEDCDDYEYDGDDDDGTMFDVAFNEFEKTVLELGGGESLFWVLPEDNGSEFYGMLLSDDLLTSHDRVVLYDLVSNEHEIVLEQLRDAEFNGVGEGEDTVADLEERDAELEAVRHKLSGLTGQPALPQSDGD